ncbi:mpv17-like protein 2 [Aplysia californica]|uniref:Mpv17-like protein 2 n=1 Tax=Aplysia californica TaxID=6500 RepID=A0ABM0JG10_APLCA|nr:mpv17-like protein 2 [Aplysia californica]
MNPARKVWTFRHMFASAQQVGTVLFSRRYLLYTNTGISVSLSVSGDILQQRYQLMKHNSDKSSLNVKRTGQMAVCGFLAGPVAHYWYILLDRWLPGRCARTIVKKVILDQLVCSPIFIGLYLVSIGILDDKKWELLKEEFATKGVWLFLGDCLIWIPAQICNFAILPTRFRVLFDNMVSLFADVFYSYVIFDHECDNMKPLSKDTLRVERM